jgi:hypothetical protein
VDLITVERALVDFKHILNALEQAGQALENLLIKEGFKNEYK